MITALVLSGSLGQAELLNLALRLALSAVTLISGLGKLVDPAGGRQAMADFGLPSRWVDPAARLLPAFEIALSLAVLLNPTATWACAGLAGLFLVFSLGIANLLRQDKAPPCNCFGAVHSEPVSSWTFIRALGLAGLSLVGFVLPVYRLPLATALVTYLSAAGVNYLVAKRMQKERETKLNRLRVGQRIPALQLDNGTWLQDVLPDQDKSLLFLTSPRCGPCRQLKDSLAQYRDRIAADLRIVEIREAVDSMPDEDPTSLPVSSNDFKRFLSPTPGALLVDRTGTILTPPVAGGEEIEALIRVILKQVSLPPKRS